MEQSARTVVAVFDDYPTAERVVRELTSAGIPRNAIEVRSNMMTGTASAQGGATHEREGGVSGFLHRLFGSDEPEDYFGHYAEAIRRGNAIVAVTAEEQRSNRVVEIMNRNGAIDIDRRVEEFRQTGYKGYDPNAPAYTAEQAMREREQFRQRGETVIPVVEEEIQIGKRTIQRGGVRVTTHLVEEPVEEQVRLREETVRVDRRKVDRPVGQGDLDKMRDQSIEMEEMTEEPVVQKRARVKEEIAIGKEAKERTETVRDKVRRTEVKVDKTGTSGADYSADFRRDYETNYARSGVDYSSIEPAYQYGYRMSSDPRYQGRSWSDVESTLKTDYLRNNPNNKWDHVRGAIRYGWERTTGKR